MQSIHEGTGAMLVLTLLSALLFIPVLLYFFPRPKFGSMHPTYCHELPPPCDSASHTDTIVPKGFYCLLLHVNVSV